MISHCQRAVPLGLATVSVEVLPVTVRSWPGTYLAERLSNG